jgi:hypothetical protein
MQDDRALKVNDVQEPETDSGHYRYCIAAASAASAQLHATGTHVCEKGLKLLYVWLEYLVIHVTVQKGRPGVPFSIQGFYTVTPQDTAHGC